MTAWMFFFLLPQLVALMQGREDHGGLGSDQFKQVWNSLPACTECCFCSLLVWPISERLVRKYRPSWPLSEGIQTSQHIKFICTYVHLQCLLFWQPCILTCLAGSFIHVAFTVLGLTRYHLLLESFLCSWKHSEFEGTSPSRVYIRHLYVPYIEQYTTGLLAFWEEVMICSFVQMS